MSRKLSAFAKRTRRTGGWQKGDALSAGIYRACKISADEQELVITPALQALVALREGKATHSQWVAVEAALRIAVAIEKQGIVNGLHDHISLGNASLQSVYSRSMRAGEWTPGALYAHELLAITEAMRLHRFQMAQLGRGELIAALASDSATRSY